VTALPVIFRGENRLFARRFRLASGETTIPVATFSAVQVELIQDGKVRATLVRGTDDELRNGSEADELILELTSTRSRQLKKNLPLTLLWELRIANEAYAAEGGTFIDRVEETPVMVR